MSGSKPSEVIFLHGERYERDPLSTLFEDLPDEELEMLAENIRADGQKLPVTINSANGLVLDGWQRLRACELIGLQPKVEEVDIPNPAAFVMAVNEHRRGSTAPTVTQRALLATDLLMLEWKARGGKGRKPTVEKVSEAAGVGRRTVEQIRRAIRYDSKHNTDFEERMRAGQCSASRSHIEIVKLRREAANEQESAQRDADTTPFAMPTPSASGSTRAEEDSDFDDEWKEELRERLLELTPIGFERFTAELLKDVGYREVHVTPPSGDGGVDGTAVGPLTSARIAFQCKRYQGSVGAPAVRDLRGAVDGRCESGLLITTGTFTREARDEAGRMGAKQIHLIDGKTLCDLLKEHRVGIDVRMVEEVSVDHDYFDQFEDGE